MAREPERSSKSLTSLSLADAASVLSKASGIIITEAMIQQDVDAGAPLNTDRTLNLIHFAAWLVKGIADAD